jgi:hypothetical protein
MRRYPWHASCLVKWTLPDSCQNVQTRLNNQFRAWQVRLNLPLPLYRSPGNVLNPTRLIGCLFILWNLPSLAL